MKKIIKCSNFIKSNTYLSIHNLGGISSNPSLRYIFHYNKITQKIKLIIKFFLGLVLDKESYYKLIYFRKFNHYKNSKFNYNV